MRVSVIAVNKIKDRALRELLDDYSNRIGRYARFEEIEIKDGNDSQLLERFQKSIPARAKTVALEVQAKSYTSSQFSTWIDKCENQSVAALTFLIGGAYGLPKELSKKADMQLSLSTFTLPHRLARLLLFEQIYRAYSISRGEPYAHE